jgi:hypothetical protein
MEQAPGKMIFTKSLAKTREFNGTMSMLRAFPFSVTLQCDGLVSHSCIGGYKKRICVVLFKKCRKSSTIKSDKIALHQQRIKEIARCKEVFTNSYPGLFITLRVLDQCN